MQAAHPRRVQRRQQQAENFPVGCDAGVAVQLGADLQHFARLRHAGGHGTQHTPRIAQPRHAGLVEQVRVDARDLRSHIRAYTEQASGERVGQLEGLQLEIAAGSGEQRIEVLDQRRLHEAVPVIAEVVEQCPPQALQPLRLGGQDVVDLLREHPLTHKEMPGGRYR